MKDIEDYVKKKHCRSSFPALQKTFVFVWHFICSKRNAIQYVCMNVCFAFLLVDTCIIPHDKNMHNIYKFFVVINTVVTCYFFFFNSNKELAKKS